MSKYQGLYLHSPPLVLARYVRHSDVRIISGDTSYFSTRLAEVEDSNVLSPHHGSTSLSIAGGVNEGNGKDEWLTLLWVGSVSVWGGGQWRING